MNAQEARQMTEAAHERRRNEDERLLKTALDLVFKAVAQAADEGRSEVEVKFMNHWLGECPVIHWDGGERTEVSEAGKEVVRRLKAEGYKAEMTTIGLWVKW